MKPLFTQIGKTPQDNLIVVKREVPYWDTPFHFHPECELVYTLSGTGKRIIGDSIEVFGPGDMVFLGPNIPHVWYSDPSFYKNDNNRQAVAIVVYFSKEIFGEKFFQLEETQQLKEFLKKAERGLKIQGRTFEQIAEMLSNMVESNGMKKIVGLMQVLERLAGSEEVRSLASITYKNSYDTKDNHKIDEVFLYLNKNFMRDISMPEVAELCHMTPQSFCRFFKARTKSTFIDFLNDIRISHARKLLIESEEQTIAEIAYLCGYKNLSNFNKLFKIKTKLTPKEYKRNLKANWIKEL
ncbi:AraC family transcriptional regulator [Terrimonas pollutisoli]|uniref:AraC family transcriptional regulator n=1 Tax=Terrimonas pollutisoli TaxID=3034147 RepID=UPI0023EE013B|nr:AraC family transcriptional regulator [Terrimonas sp. H1YJ31]